EAVPSGEPAAAASEPGVSAPAVPALCPFCQAPRTGAQAYCDNCGLIFPAEMPPAPAPANGEPAASPKLLAGRYQHRQGPGERRGSSRYGGVDQGAGLPQGVPVVILQAPHGEATESVPAAEALPAAEEDSIQDSEFAPALPAGEDASLPLAVAQPVGPVWPS